MRIITKIKTFKTDETILINGVKYVCLISLKTPLKIQKHYQFVYDFYKVKT